MTIRRIADAERAEVERLAARDSAPVPRSPLLGLEVEGRLVAVTSLTSGETVADPFQPTAEPRAILELRAAQLRRAGAGGRSPRLSLRRPRRERAAGVAGGIAAGRGQSAADAEGLAARCR